MVQEIWAKFNANERLVAWGAVAIIVGFIVSLIGSFGYGGGLLVISLLGAIAALVVLYLKYAPNSNVNWPAPVPVVLFAISAVVGIIELLALVSVLGALSLAGFFGLWLLGVIVTIIGGALMLYASYMEWQASQKTA